MMKLITKEIEAKLLKNIGNEETAKPYLKLFNPMGPATWLISEYDKKSGIMFGLCDLGMGSPELGSVSLKEIEEIKLPFELGIERDMYWEPEKTLAEYAKDAREAGSIIDIL